jgi:hypothetical protein
MKISQKIGGMEIVKCDNLERENWRAFAFRKKNSIN